MVQSCTRPLGVELLLKAGDGLAGQPVDLQGPDDPFGVVGVDAAGRLRVDLPQGLVQAGQSLALGLGPQLGPDQLVAAGAFEEPVEQGLDVQGRAAHGDDGLAPAADVLDGREGLVQEQPHAERFARLDHVDQMVPDLLLGLFGGLGRADIHAAVDLHRVHADDLAVEGPGQLESQPGLARGGHAQDQNHS